MVKSGLDTCSCKTAVNLKTNIIFYNFYILKKSNVWYNGNRSSNLGIHKQKYMPRRAYTTSKSAESVKQEAIKETVATKEKKQESRGSSHGLEENLN